MTPKDYIKNVLVTEAKDFTALRNRLNDDKNIRLIHASAGITSEIAELFQLSEKPWDGDNSNMDRINLMEECGDILWYIGIATDALNDTESNVIDIITSPSKYQYKAMKHDDDLNSELYSTAARLSTLAGQFADFSIKKFVFYGKPFNETPLVNLLSEIHLAVDILLQRSGFTIEDARERNIAKLKARYGEKFSEAAALERNLAAEREILEKK